MNLLDVGTIEQAIAPFNISGVGAEGAWVLLRAYQHVTIQLTQGFWTDGTPAVTLEQATDAAGAGAVPLPFTQRWEKHIDDDLYVKLPVVGDTFALPNKSDMLHAIELDASALDMSAGYVFLRVVVGAPGAADDFLSGVYILTLPTTRTVVLPSGKA